MDFSAWMEAYLGGRWYSFDARHNQPRIGRIVIARGRPGLDVATTPVWWAAEPSQALKLNHPVSFEDHKRKAANRHPKPLRPYTGWSSGGRDKRRLSDDVSLARRSADFLLWSRYLNGLHNSLGFC
jgi:transglutaminase-like putative cysteine protease